MSYACSLGDQKRASGPPGTRIPDNCASSCGCREETPPPPACVTAAISLNHATGFALTQTGRTSYSRTPGNGRPQVYGSLLVTAAQMNRDTNPLAQIPGGLSPVQPGQWDPGSGFPQTLLPNPPTTSYPLLRVQEDLGIKELVAVIVLALPLGHQFAEAGSITNEAWRGSGARDTCLASSLWEASIRHHHLPLPYSSLLTEGRWDASQLRPPGEHSKTNGTH